MLHDEDIRRGAHPGPAKAPGHRTSYLPSRPRTLAAILANLAACAACTRALPTQGALRSPPPPPEAVNYQRLRAIGDTAAAKQHEQKLRNVAATSDDSDQHDLMESYVLDEAEVVGLVSEAEQAAFEAEYEVVDAEGEAEGEILVDNLDGLRGSVGAEGDQSRRLLMQRRNRKPSKYPNCNRCLILRCGRHGNCSGKCKKNRYLYHCVGSGSQKTCERPNMLWQTRPDLVTPDRLAPLSSAVVTASWPYIACANITGLPTGCPAISTPGFAQHSDDRTYIGTYCRQHQPLIHECESPFFPFGHCMLQYIDHRPGSGDRVREEPCTVFGDINGYIDMENATSPSVDGGPDPLLRDQRVYLDADPGAWKVNTTFHEYAHASETDGPTYSYRHAFGQSNPRARSIGVQLDIFYTFYTRSFNFTEIGFVVLPEYVDDPETLAYDEMVEDYYFTPPYSPERECVIECQLAGGDLLGGGLPGSGLTVIYYDKFDCSYCYDDDVDYMSAGDRLRNRYKFGGAYGPLDYDYNEVK